MYKEYREMTRTDAVEALYSDMAARHRARFRSVHVSQEISPPPPRTKTKTDWADIFVQILKVVEIPTNDQIRRPYIKQLLTKDLKFPLPHRAPKTGSKKIFAAKRPSTFA